MTIYKNSNTQSAIDSVEFMPVPEGNSTFLHLKSGSDIDGVKQWLTLIGQQVLAQANTDTQTVLVTRGDKSQEDILSSFKATGEQLKEPETKRKVNMWALRGWGSIIGQPMQLISGILQKGPPDMATIGFSVSNMAANITNVIFGAEKRTDPHHLRFIKEKVNTLLTPYLPEGTELPDPSEKRAGLRKEPEEPKSVGQKFHDFMQAHSVVFGDIFLRYIGSISLAFSLKKPDPLTGKPSYGHWKKGFGQLFDGEFKTAYDTLKNTDKATHYAGLMYLGGKMLSLTSEVKDPYDTKKKHTWLDTAREKFVFPISSVIEAGAAGLITLDRFNLITLNVKTDEKTGKAIIDENTGKPIPIERKMSVKRFVDDLEKQGKQVPKWLGEINTKLEAASKLNKGEAGRWLARDWIGGVGGIFLTAGLVMRFFAPFAVKQVNMDEVDAHVADSLALIPNDKLPQATAEAAAFLTEHFKDKKLEFSKVYTQLRSDLYKYHHIAMPTAEGGMGHSAEAQIAEPEQEAKKFAKPELQKTDITTLPRPGSFQEIANASSGMALSRT